MSHLSKAGVNVGQIPQSEDQRKYQGTLPLMQSGHSLHLVLPQEVILRSGEYSVISYCG